MVHIIKHFEFMLVKSNWPCIYFSCITHIQTNNFELESSPVQNSLRTQRKVVKDIETRYGACLFLIFHELYRIQ